MTYAPAVYIAAAIAQQMWNALQDDRLEHFSYPQTEDQFCEWFERNFQGHISRAEAAAAIGVLDAIGLITFDEDPFAGRFLKADARVFAQRWREIGKTSFDSPFAKAAEFGEPWFKAVFDNQIFWSRLHDEDPGYAPFLLPSGLLRSPEPVVFIVEGSAESIELREGLESLADELRTNNEIANELGEDRSRILAEVTASKGLVSSGSVRIGVVKELMIKVLREIARKLKDKAVGLGIDRLLEIALKLVGS